MNKKGDEKIMALWWFFVIVIISVSIISGVLIYYGADIDIRDAEARILSERLNECLISGGYLNSEIYENDFDLFLECNLNEILFDLESRYYIGLTVKDLNDNFILEKHYGQKAFENDCIIVQNIKSKELSKCYLTKVKVISNNKEVFLQIISSSNQEGRRSNLIK